MGNRPAECGERITLEIPDPLGETGGKLNAEYSGAFIIRPTVPAERRPTPTMMIFNEVPLLGKAQFMVDTMSARRGYGIKVQVVCHIISKFKRLYGEGWTEIPGNAGILQFFGGTMDMFSAGFISKLIGKKTDTKTSMNRADKTGDGSVNWSVFARDLAMPGEVARNPDSWQIVYVKGRGPGRCQLLNQDKDFREMPQYKAFINAMGLR